MKYNAKIKDRAVYTIVPYTPGMETHYEVYDLTHHSLGRFKKEDLPANAFRTTSMIQLSGGSFEALEARDSIVYKEGIEMPIEVLYTWMIAELYQPIPSPTYEELRSENELLYACILEAVENTAISVAGRCKLELQRIAMKDAGISPKPFTGTTPKETTT